MGMAQVHCTATTYLSEYGGLPEYYMEILDEMGGRQITVIDFHIHESLKAASHSGHIELKANSSVIYLEEGH